MIEVWRNIKGYEGKYQISNMENVKSLNYNNTGKPRLLKPKINRYGYKEVKLSKNNKTRNFLVSTLYVRHFINQKNKNTIYKGKKYKSFSSLARHFGIEPKLFFKRLRNGWDIDEALQIPLERDYRILNVKLFNYNGKLLSVRQLAELSGISKRNIYKRINRGWSVEEAVEIPIS